RGLKTNRPNANPAPRAIDFQTDVRHETKRQQHNRKRKPDPPRPLPELVIHARTEHACENAEAEPHRLALYEIARVAVAVLRKGTGAKEHHNPERNQSADGNDEEINAFTMHEIWEAHASRAPFPATRPMRHVSGGHAPVRSFASVCLFRRNFELLADL